MVRFLYIFVFLLGQFSCITSSATDVGFDRDLGNSVNSRALKRCGTLMVGTDLGLGQIPFVLMGHNVQSLD